MNVPINIPNLLTAMRIAAIVPAVSFIMHGWYVLGGFVVALAGITDFIDGRVARKCNQVTKLGSVLDPVADKLFISVLFVCLGRYGLLPTWLVSLVVIRNVAQLMSIPILSWWLKRDFKVAPKWQPKWASALSYVIIVNILLIVIPGVHPYLLATLDLMLFVEMSLLVPLEIYVLATYIPRLLQISFGSHDTFE